MNKYLRLLLAAVTSVFFISCNQIKQPEKIQFFGEAQGTYYAVTYFAMDTLVTQNQIDSLLVDFDLSASTWVGGSIISRINNNDPDIKPDKYFTDIFKQAQRVSEMTNGAFDITVGPLVNAWGFGFKNRMDIDQHIIDSLLPFVNYKAVRIIEGEVIKENPNINIDYNAIAQGYSVDLLGGFLEKNGIENYLVDVGGEVLAKGVKPDDNHWVVGIERPSEEIDSERKLKATLKISNKAIATSGNYRKFYEVDGVRYSHTINPKTGYPVKHSLLSATVMADSAAIADAFATAFMVMGLQKAKLFLESHPGMEAYFIYSGANGQLETYSTGGLQSKITEQ